MSPIVSPRRPLGRSRRPAALRVLSGHGGRSEPLTYDPDKPLTYDPDTTATCRPALRIVTEARDEAIAHDGAPVLLAGADASRRAALRAEFGATLPRGATFSEADDVSEVLERAPSSRMVVLAGDLDDADADSLMRLLGRRHPRLAVICVEEPMPATAAGRG